MSDPALRLLAISGSLRAAANSTAIARSLADLAPANCAVDVRTLEDVPLYNGDLEGENCPPGPAALRADIAAADGLVLVSPEYNYSMPGVLKNAIDWASRPAFASCLVGKPVLIVTSSPGPTGGVRAQAPLRETLSGTLARVIARRQVVIPEVAKKIVDGRFSDEKGREVLADALAELVAEIGRAQD